MSEGQSWGLTVLGWFIVREATGSTSGVVTPSAPEGASGADSAAQAAPAPTFFQTEPPAAPGGQVDFDGVFGAAGIGPEERDRVGKAAAMLASLPSESPVAVRKQIVEASLKAFGVPIEKIIEAGVQRSRRWRRTSARARPTPKNCTGNPGRGSRSSRPRSRTSAVMDRARRSSRR